jgi:hypothetical protein
MITVHQNMVTICQETIGIHHGKSGDFPDVSSENSQTNGHNPQEMVGIYQEKIRRFPAGILLPCSNVFPMFSCRNRSVILDLGRKPTTTSFVGFIYFRLVDYSDDKIRSYLNLAM